MTRLYEYRITAKQGKQTYIFYQSAQCAMDAENTILKLFSAPVIVKASKVELSKYTS